MATTRDDVQDATGQRTNIPGYGFTRGFGTGTQYQNTANTVNGVAGNPINGETGWAPGAIFINPKSATVGQLVWINEGSSTSALWSNIDKSVLPGLPPAKYVTQAYQSAAVAAGDLTGAEFVNFDNTGTTPGTVTTRTAAQMFADIPGCYVGFSYMLAIRNSSGSANTLTLGAADGSVTLTGTMTVAQTVTRFFVVTFVSATAVTFQSMGISAAGA